VTVPELFDPPASVLACGIDEAGRGPLAGPVCAAAVILPPDFPREILDDSKRLSRKKREEAEILIKSRALAWGIGWASHTEIDKINILRASLLAMKRAFEALALRPEFVWVDGNFFPDIDTVGRALPKADTLIPEVMAASILAKTARDLVMERWALICPEYGYERHKGYPTEEHRRICRERGPSPIQRMSFKY
jgi:ribonuclease HII